MGLGTNGRKRADELRRALAFQRWFLRRITPEQARWEAYQAFEAFARELQERRRDAVHAAGRGRPTPTAPRPAPRSRTISPAPSARSPPILPTRPRSARPRLVA